MPGGFGGTTEAETRERAKDCARDGTAGLQAVCQLSNASQRDVGVAGGSQEPKDEFFARLDPSRARAPRLPGRPTTGQMTNEPGSAAKGFHVQSRERFTSHFLHSAPVVSRRHGVHFQMTKVVPSGKNRAGRLGTPSFLHPRKLAVARGKKNERGV